MTSSEWTFGWGAVEALATVLTFIAAAITLPILAFQSRMSRMAYVETMLDNTTNDYVLFKNELYELDVKRQLRDPYSWEELGSLRMAAIRAELFLPSIRQMAQIGSDERADQFAKMYTADVRLVAELVDYATQRIRDTYESQRRRMSQYFVDALEEWGASPEEVDAYKSYEGVEQNKADNVYSMVRTRYFTTQGMSVDDIVKMDTEQNAECDMDAISILRHYDQGHDAAALVSYWRRELVDLRVQVATLQNTFVTKIGSN